MAGSQAVVRSEFALPWSFFHRSYEPGIQNEVCRDVCEFGFVGGGMYPNSGSKPRYISESRFPRLVIIRIWMSEISRWKISPDGRFRA